MSEDAVENLKKRLAEVEKTVNEHLIPKLDANTTITQAIETKVTEMYTAYTTAVNGVKLLAWLGEKFIWIVDHGGKIARAFFFFFLAGGAGTTFIKWDKIIEFISKFTQ